MNSTTTTTEDPATIEQDIRRTQDDMSRTVDKIGDQLTIKNVVNSLLDKADENNVDARMLLDGARRNPMALGLIAAGAIWLVSDKDSKFPSMPSKDSKSDELDLGGHDVHHRDYVSHMSSVEFRDGEDPIAYQRRRDLARSNFFMVERDHEEDDHSFKQRLDSMTETFREKRQAWSDSAGRGSDAAKEKARMAVSKTQDMYSNNPLVGGILAAAVGAAFGSTLPITRTEQEKLGDVGEKARDMASEKKEQVTSQLREKKDEMLDRADEKLQQNKQGGGQQPENRQSSEFSGTEPATQEAPFIIGDPVR
ncbi:MAG: DUF3618 domain-containing protein [Pseudomonadota bacterium]|nr:DUF3618 domain-containing protein [Pseudomonadota bacterium]